MEDVNARKKQFGHQELIARMLQLYNNAQPYSYVITRWPDEEERTARACDAFAEAPGANPLAIEHTKIETFVSRKLDDARFLKVVGSLENELKNTFPYWVELWIPTFALQPGTDWAAVKSRIKAWLLQKIPILPGGRAKYNVPGVPFPITIEKDADLRGNFLVGRLVPPGEDDRTELVGRFISALTDKDEQLCQYRNLGAETILLAESDDIALVSLQTLYRAFLLGWDTASPQNINQVWMAHSYAPEDWCEIVCFRGPDEIMDRVNPPNYGYGPRHRHAWLAAMRQEGFAGMH